MENATARNGVCRVRAIVVDFHSHEVGPAFFGASFANQRLYILLWVGKYYEDNGVKTDWTWIPACCVELEGGDEDKGFHLVDEGRQWTG